MQACLVARVDNIIVHIYIVLSAKFIALHIAVALLLLDMLRGTMQREYCTSPLLFECRSPALSIFESHVQTQADVFKPYAQIWDGTLLTRLLHWTINCSNYFRQPCVGAFCGIFKLGAATRDVACTKVPPSGTTPPYALANAFLAQPTVSSTGK